MRNHVALVALVVVACTGCGSFRPKLAPPAGYVFPTHDTSSGGAAALLTGVLEDREGCLYVRPDGGPDYLVIWPDTYALVIDAGNPTIVEDGRALGRVGDTLRVGGGESIRSTLTAEAGRCEGNVWGATRIIPPGG